MKVRRSAVATAALAVSGAYAQSSSITATPSTSYTTVTYSDCPSMSMENMVTITNGITVTYCPECEMASSKPGYTTVYTTQYEAVCPTGMTTSTYTVTESCTDSTPTWTPGPQHIPQGFTVTTQVCTQCGETPQTVTVTQPCGCEAHEGSMVTPTPTAGFTPAGQPAQSAPAQTTAASAPSGEPVGQISDGQVQASTGAGRPAAPAGSVPAGSSGSGSSPAPNSGSGSGSSPALNGGSGSSAPAAAPGAGSGNGTAPAMATTAATCPGPACRAGASSMPSGVAPNWSSSSGSAGSGPEASTGAASSLGSFGLFWSAFLALAIGALAFML